MADTPTTDRRDQTVTATETITYTPSPFEADEHGPFAFTVDRTLSRSAERPYGSDEIEMSVEVRRPEDEPDGRWTAWAVETTQQMGPHGEILGDPHGGEPVEIGTWDELPPAAEAWEALTSIEPIED